MELGYQDLGDASVDLSTQTLTPAQYHQAVQSLTPVLGDGLFTGVRLNNFRLFNHYAYFHLWSNFYSQSMVIFPYLLMGPSLFTGLITLGVIQQVSNAFGKVNEAFSYLIERWTDITELRSIYKRLTEFENGLA